MIQAADSSLDHNRSVQVTYEALNRYVLMAIGLFALLLYLGVIWAGFAEFIVRMASSGESKKDSGRRGTPRRLRSVKRSR